MRKARAGMILLQSLEEMQKIIKQELEEGIDIADNIDMDEDIDILLAMISRQFHLTSKDPDRDRMLKDVILEV